MKAQHVVSPKQVSSAWSHASMRPAKKCETTRYKRLAPHAEPQHTREEAARRAAAHAREQSGEATRTRTEEKSGAFFSGALFLVFF